MAESMKILDEVEPLKSGLYADGAYQGKEKIALNDFRTHQKAPNEYVRCSSPSVSPKAEMR